jgi:predicted nucleotidyltransferase
MGSLANWDRTEGDIDILVKAKDPSPLLKALDHAVATLLEKKEDALADLMIQIYQFIHTDSVFLNAKWRIERAFPDWLGRLQILDDSFSGPRLGRQTTNSG